MKVRRRQRRRRRAVPRAGQAACVKQFHVRRPRRRLLCRLHWGHWRGSRHRRLSLHRASVRCGAEEVPQPRAGVRGGPGRRDRRGTRGQFLIYTRVGCGGTLRGLCGGPSRPGVRRLLGSDVQRRKLRRRRRRRRRR
ncbi:uncharacterized protein Tco025E_00112 [Trypanosoma conorhini]|uniref:Uncharacterized protein n=1 Tax=Trypanosoma conorhini TaxID=83891 RepID=A0A3R7LMS3_9TRYP|nr:uncharacterized protein Tco025E_00112 [Trypanosoma conorhini]RNF27728.1 hypothetical protein Tco025E_00112 [Trypanosoma conorhini]